MAHCMGKSYQKPKYRGETAVKAGTLEKKRTENEKNKKCLIDRNISVSLLHENTLPWTNVTEGNDVIHTIPNNVPMFELN